VKILYGVQATGNGHITRARAMNQAFKNKQIDVDFLFSGREKKHLFDMEEFGDFRCYRGLTFVTQSGSVQLLASIKKSNVCQLYRDIRALDLSQYDLVLTDFEPISAWAARAQHKKTIAIGHQYAFEHDIPKAGDNFITRLFMRYFAPAELQLGLHWHHFDQLVLPPIAQTHSEITKTIDNKIVVYLGFESPEDTIRFIAPFTHYDFYIYGEFSDECHSSTKGLLHINLCPLSRQGFKEDLASCNGVISNAGFELSSEAIHLGKKILVKPLSGQMEQLSNAKALEQLGLGLSMKSLDPIILKNWLNDFEGKRIIYPDVAAAIVNWIIEGLHSSRWKNYQAFADSLWKEVKSTDIKNYV
jgi:uncharacterized protein (TIGR00661 family)